jgi:hypothetical protein
MKPLIWIVALLSATQAFGVVVVYRYAENGKTIGNSQTVPTQYQDYTVSAPDGQGASVLGFTTGGQKRFVVVNTEGFHIWQFSPSENATYKVVANAQSITNSGYRTTKSYFLKGLAVGLHVGNGAIVNAPRVLTGRTFNVGPFTASESTVKLTFLQSESVQRNKAGNTVESAVGYYVQRLRDQGYTALQ